METIITHRVTQAAPWWQFGHVWLVITGPLVVVIAALFTAYVAFSGADVVVHDTTAQSLQADRAPNDPTQLSRQDRALVPATQARNHAATPFITKP